MKCYHCGCEDLPLAALTPRERRDYAAAGIVLRRCQGCGYYQNHIGDGEPVEPHEAANAAPPRDIR